MNRFLFFYILLSFTWSIVHAELQYPADISYLVSDVKYSKEHGLKICEVQHGSLSALGGDIYTAGEDGRMCPMIADLLAQFTQKKWGVGWMYQPLKRSLAAKEWKMEQSIQKLFKDPIFLACAKTYPTNPHLIQSYAGIVYADFEIGRNLQYYRNNFPGILCMNGITFAYWNDKAKMNALFDLNNELSQYKADWKLYPKKYNPLLAERIHQEMPCDYYVIKPRSEVLANGVLIVAAGELDAVLKMILQPAANLEKHADKKYAYWCKNKDEVFIIEKYYASDYLCFSSPLSQATTYHQECHYDATMRIACILQCDGGKMSYQCMGGFWKLPSKALEEEGTLNEKRISCCTPPFYKEIDTELLREVNVHMEKAMLLLYEVMLSRQQ